MRHEDTNKISLLFAMAVSVLFHIGLIVLITGASSSPTVGRENKRLEDAQAYRVLETLRHRLVEDPLLKPPVPVEKEEAAEHAKDEPAPPPPAAKAPEDSKDKVTEKADTKPETPPEEDASPAEEVIEVNASLIERGKGMVGDKGEALGRFPPLEASYKSIGFWNYLAHIKRLGARFFVLNRRKGSLVTGVDPVTRSFYEVKNTNGLSPRSRDLSDEAALRGILVEANRRFGQAPYSIIFLLPLNLDAAVVAAQAQALGGDLGGYRKIYGHYELRGGRLALRLSSAETRKGEAIPLNSLIELDR